MSTPISSAAESAERLAQAAWLYYVDGLTQAEIAKALFVSRPTVGRLLHYARETGVVRIDIDTSHLTEVGTAAELKRKFHLEDAVVLPAPGHDLSLGDQFDRVAAAAAMYVRKHLHPGAVVGLAWGETVQRVLAHLPVAMLEGTTLVALSGGIEYLNARIASYPEVVDRLRPIPAPLFVSTDEVAATLREEEFIKAVLDLGRTAEVTLTSIGTPTVESTISRIGLLPASEYEAVRDAGGIGDMLGQWFDRNGDPINVPGAHRHIGLSLAELSDQEEVVAVVAGVHKVEAVRAALHGGYVDVLITDEALAKGLLNQGDR